MRQCCAYSKIKGKVKNGQKKKKKKIMNIKDTGKGHRFQSHSIASTVYHPLPLASVQSLSSLGLKSLIFKK